MAGVRAAKPIRVKRRAATKREVLAKLAVVRAELDGGVDFSAGSRPTVEQWMTHWIDHVRVNAARTPSPKTMIGYRADTRLHITPGIGDIRLEKLTTSDVERVYRTMADSGLALGTITHVSRTLSAALAAAVKRRVIHTSPARDAVIPGSDNPVAEVEPLTSEESMRILEAARWGRNAARWRVALSLGLRQGEALGLQVDDVDLEAGTLTVRRQVMRLAWTHGCGDLEACRHPRTGKLARGCDCPQRLGPGGLVTRDTTKGGKGRTLVLTASLHAELVVHLRTLSAEQERAQGLWVSGPGDGYLFPTITGRPTDPRRDYADWRELLETAGVRRARLHDARHTAATLLLTAGLADASVMATFGWGSPTMITRYSHVMDAHRRQVAAAMDAALPALPPALRPAPPIVDTEESA